MVATHHGGRLFGRGENRRILLLERQKSAGRALVNQNITRVIAVIQIRLDLRSGTLSALSVGLGLQALRECSGALRFSSA